MLIVLALERKREVDICEFKVSLGYKVRAIFEEERREESKKRGKRKEREIEEENIFSIKK